MARIGRSGGSFVLVAFVVMILGVSACGGGGSADLNIDVVGGQDTNESQAGTDFFDGLWDGLVSPFTLIASIFSDDVTVYDSSGGNQAYGIGFGIGLILMFLTIAGLFGLSRRTTSA